MLPQTITILTITFNSFKYIERCYNSILNQTYKNWHWLIIDDGSTDNSKVIIDSFSDSRIKYYCLDKNYGRGYARNFALSKVTTLYIAILDMDDFMLSSRLEHFICAISSGYDGLVSPVILIDSDYNVSGVRGIHKFGNHFEFAHASLCIKANILKNILYSEFRHAEDQHVLLSLSKLQNILVSSVPLYVYHECATINLKSALFSKYYSLILFFQYLLRGKGNTNIYLIVKIFASMIKALILGIIFYLPFREYLYRLIVNQRRKTIPHQFDHYPEILYFKRKYSLAK
jgi:glycosyltransferase involved in cell wall biosynthesis